MLAKMTHSKTLKKIELICVFPFYSKKTPNILIKNKSLNLLEKKNYNSKWDGGVKG